MEAPWFSISYISRHRCLSLSQSMADVSQSPIREMFFEFGYLRLPLIRRPRTAAKDHLVSMLLIATKTPSIVKMVERSCRVDSTESILIGWQAWQGWARRVCINKAWIHRFFGRALSRLGLQRNDVSWNSIEAKDDYIQHPQRRSTTGRCVYTLMRG